MATDNKQKILDLYAEIDRIYEEISLLEAAQGWGGSTRGEGHEFLSEALRANQASKWKDAIPIFKKSYGQDFCFSGTIANRKLVLDMYGELGMPDAPDRSDHSEAANQIRQRRKDVRSKVHVYITRMRSYLEKTER